MTSNALVVLMPSLQRLGSAALPAEIGKAIARADASVGDAGEPKQLARYFQLPHGAGWPIAALQREATGSEVVWLRADPVWWQADLSTARLMAWGNLGLSAEEADALIATLAPSFLEAGLTLDRLAPEQWFLRTNAAMPIPAFGHPSDALGDDTFQHLPSGPESRRWRGLLSEAQVLLHHHPLNAERQAQGLPPINSLWFWGAGCHPGPVRTDLQGVFSRDAELIALASAAGVPVAAEPRAAPGHLLDLRHQRSASDWADMLGEVIALLVRGEVPSVRLDSADGRQFLLRRSQRWRFWRRPRRSWSP